MTRSRCSSPAPEVFPIYLFVYLFIFVVVVVIVVVTGFVLKDTSPRDCLPRRRSIGREAPSFLPGVLHRHSQLPRKSDRNFRSSPEMGDLHHVIVRSKNSSEGAARPAGWHWVAPSPAGPMTAVFVRFFVGVQERIVLPEWPKSSLFSMAIA